MTQKETLLKYLKENESITSLECVTKLFIIDLQGVVRNLKEDGYTNYIYIYKNKLLW